MVGEHHHGGSSSTEEDEGAVVAERVRVDDYGKRTKGADGVYELFQQTADPGR